ncbi:MAG: Lrp/AsnC ligand binding domain-containing protein [Candidatus Bathyarchaeota archaeon]|nr:Lrp/AsnC ligand binding domain-containing protein [Candidatus Bathyarchaeota archaeon]
MATAFLLLNIETGLEVEVMKDLKDLDEVKEVHKLDGTYDVIARMETDTMQELKDAVNWKIRRLENVYSTLTMIVM